MALVAFCSHQEASFAAELLNPVIFAPLLSIAGTVKRVLCPETQRNCLKQNRQNLRDIPSGTDIVPA